jgi:hypothetical protein
MVRQLTKKDAYSAFEYALKATETKRQWPDTRVKLCLQMQQNGDVDPGKDCYSWVLTYDGMYEITKKVLFEKSYSIEGN